MRISDWSSDVCSSDLAMGGPGRTRKALGHRRHARLERRRERLENTVVRRAALLRLAGIARLQNACARPAIEVPQLPAQIGRASCRERGCQYVEISVVAVSLKKTT